jgi:hypothetical protein
MTNKSFDFFNFLINKINSFDENTARRFHSTHEKAFPTKSLYVWEQVDIINCDGFVYYGPQFAAYFDANGVEVCLTSFTSHSNFVKAWSANKLLYQECLLHNNVSMVNPVGITGDNNNYTTYHVNGIDYILYMIQHPNHELGEYIMTTPDNIDDYYKLCISSVENILMHINTVIKNSPALCLGYPSLRLPDLLKNSKQYYWRHFHLWDLTADGVYKKLIGDIEKCIETFPRQGQVSSFDVLKEAEYRWKKVLNI